MGALADILDPATFAGAVALVILTALVTRYVEQRRATVRSISL